MFSIQKLYDRQNRFYSFFDPRNGFYLRSGIIDENGKDTGADPFKAFFPQLIDVGIMGHCLHGVSGKCLQAGIECYQDGRNIYQPNMKLNDFKKIIVECRGKTFQIAIGGRGDPDQHECFEEILSYSRENNIVPNFTTSGYTFNDKKAKLCKKYCGAVAVSWYCHKHTDAAIKNCLPKE